MIEAPRQIRRAQPERGAAQIEAQIAKPSQQKVPRNAVWLEKPDRAAAGQIEQRMIGGNRTSASGKGASPAP
ncbi:hypothetical protein [Rhodobacter viridis]|uniref:hypothetical protein n=1 Tax=Rhodobacter viridis TaxID=1054202 RepID=UPI000DA146B4|nr:hypothetical protein [Rhodobacter viridis]